MEKVPPLVLEADFWQDLKVQALGIELGELAQLKLVKLWGIMWKHDRLLKEAFLAASAQAIGFSIAEFRIFLDACLKFELLKKTDRGYHSEGLTRRWNEWVQKKAAASARWAKTRDAANEPPHDAVEREPLGALHATDTEYDTELGRERSKGEKPLKIDLPRIKLTEHQFLHLLNWFDHNEKALADACEAASDNLKSKGEFTKDPEAYMRGWRRRSEKFDAPKIIFAKDAKQEASRPQPPPFKPQPKPKVSPKAEKEFKESLRKFQGLAK